MRLCPKCCVPRDYWVFHSQPGHHLPLLGRTSHDSLPRIEYDAYRTDLEELNLGPRDANTLPKIEQSQILFQAHKEKYDKMRNDVSIKLKFLEENKVREKETESLCVCV